MRGSKATFHNVCCDFEGRHRWGAEDIAKSRIHASDESVDPTGIEHTIVAQALTLQHQVTGG